MNITKKLLLPVCLLFVIFIRIPAHASEDAERKALVSSNAWLEMVDKSRYAESRENAAELFRTAVSKEQWKQTLTSVRKPLGRVISRKPRSTQYTMTLPGAPDGEYVVIQYETTFENKKSAIETITPMLDKDGTWRVTGYYIR